MCGHRAKRLAAVSTPFSEMREQPHTERLGQREPNPGVRPQSTLSLDTAAPGLMDERSAESTFLSLKSSRGYF